MTETGTFPCGIINGKGEICRDFTLDERTFRHTLELANDKAIDKELIGNAAYYDAAILSKRLTVAGVEELTPEMVLNLCGEDGDELAGKIMVLDQRRMEFRGSAQGAAKEADSPA